MEIYLTLPGGQREGPFTLEEINRDLAAKKYNDTDYWAWYDGQTEWVPLHLVPGVIGSDETAGWVLDQPTQADASIPAQSTPAHADSSGEGPVTATADVPGALQASAHDESASAAPAPESVTTPATPPPEPERTPAILERQLFSGLPFAALEHIFILTTGDGPPASRSATTARMLEQTVGEALASIREKAHRDVLSRCSFIEQVRTKAALPAAAWSAMANYQTQLVQDARAGLYKVCVRTFPIETGDFVCLFLFYNKQKL
jgi:hypothetical protein